MAAAGTEPSWPAGGRWHTIDALEAVREAGSDATAGLSAAEARARLRSSGPNALPEAHGPSRASAFASQFKSPIVLILLGAAVIALGLRHWSDAIVIAFVVLLNAVLGLFHEGRAERALQGLRRLTGQQARVVREGSEMVIRASEVVRGDVLLLASGDVVPADGRLLDVKALQVAEAALTGESVPVLKDTRRLGPEILLGDRRNMVYAATHVTAGRARAVVVATGPSTEVGRIAALAAQTLEPKTPLERRVAIFGRHLVVGAVAMFGLVVTIGLFRGIGFTEILMVGVSQLVSVVPEGLPVAVTIALAVGVRRIARRQAIVRKLAAVETLGSTTVICSDKTGTLTRNEMIARAIYLPSGAEIEVRGEGYAPQGEFLSSGQRVAPTQNRELLALIEAGVLSNDAKLLAPDDRDPRWRAMGDPTEAALLTLAMKAGVDPAEVNQRIPRSGELPFDSETKVMATHHVDPTGAAFVIVKGAPEVVLGLSSVDASARVSRAEIEGALERMSQNELRVLAFARVDGMRMDEHTAIEDFRGRSEFLGLIGELDPPRREVAGAVEQCREAGVRVVMVTGDHKTTGVAVGRMLGIFQEGDRAVDGAEIERMSDVELTQRIEGISVFARVHPAQKLRIVTAFQRRGHVVAVTGDGVNDLPALVAADVGVAMGITGSEVAKEAAKIVLVNDHFATVVAAVEEGRVVLRNLKKVILYLVATSAAEVVILLAALLLGYPPPLAAVQILWINLVAEGTVTVNLIMEPREGDEMKRGPTPASEPLLTRVLLIRMAFMAAAIVVSTLGWFVVRLAQDVPFPKVQAETFTMLVLCSWFNVLNCRSEDRSSLNFGLLKNRWLLGGFVVSGLLQAAVLFVPPLHRVFHTTALGLGEVLALIAVASLVLWVEELRKFVVRHRSRHVLRSEVVGAS